MTVHSWSNQSESLSHTVHLKAIDIPPDPTIREERYSTRPKPAIRSFLHRRRVGITPSLRANTPHVRTHM
jgi:hypothetical protein